MPYYKFIAKLSHWSFSFLKSLTNFLDAAYSGFWLGIMSQKSLDYSDELHYNHNACYIDDLYNEKGLFDWEKSILDKHFSNVKTILLIAAGGGREALALNRMGYKVDSYECNPALVEYANKFLRKNNVNAKVSYLSRNTVPEEVKKYDGIIIGWGAYSHIQGFNKRLLFLKGLYPFMHDKSRLMISFIWVKERNRRDIMIRKISGFFGFLSKKDKTEPGDKLVPNFIHYFKEEEIKSELIQANCKIVDSDVTDHGWVIASI